MVLDHGKRAMSKSVIAVASLFLLIATIGLFWIDFLLFDGCPDTQRAATLQEPYRAVALAIHRHLSP